MATGHSFQALAPSDKGIDQDEIVSSERTKHTAGKFVCMVANSLTRNWLVIHRDKIV